MRTALLILATIVLISGAFASYLHLQPPRALPVEATRPAMQPPASRPTDTKLYPGKKPWILNFDAKTGRLASRFRSDDYFPKPSGVIYCRNPEAEFFLSNNERLKLVGEDGEIVMKDTPDVSKGFVKSGPSGPPDRGRMNHVTIYLLDNQIDDVEHETGRHLILTMKTNNIDFDNDSFLITTQEFTDEKGARVAPDQVPVKMWGDYEFEGRGLTLRWNDRDGRLELLEIAHGERLKILHPNASQRKTVEDAPAPVTSAAQEMPLEGSDLASTDRSAPGAVLRRAATRPGTTRRSASSHHPSDETDHSVYQANFYENVHVKQGEQSYADAETLRLHFILKSQPAGSGAEQTGGPAPVTSTPPENRGNDAPTKNPDVIADGSINASPTPAIKPTTRLSKAATRPAAAEEPVEIFWTGRLVVAPTATPPPRPVSPGGAVVELLGYVRQVFVHRAAATGQDASEVHCASLLYQSSDGSALLSHSAMFPQVTLNRVPDPSVAATRPAESQPAQVTCESLDYRASDHTALLLGKGHAVVPIAPEGGESAATAPSTRPDVPRVLDTKWDQQAKLYFAPRSGDEMSIERATFDGNVDILHPQLALKSQSLDLTFDPSSPTTRPSSASTDASVATPVGAGSSTRPTKSSGPVLKRALATDDVHCKLTNAAGKIQNIDCDRLELQASRDATGKSYPHQVYTSGSVHAFDETQDLRASRMDLTLRPATPKLDPTTLPSSGEAVTLAAQHHAASASPDSASAELDHMVARDNVVVTNKEGSVATTDELHVDMKGEDPHITMTGPRLSHVTDAKHNTLSGPLILVEPHQQLAHVVGPGTMHVIRDTPPGAKPPSPTDVIWSDRADVDGNSNRIDVYGKVVTTSSDADGTINNASGEHVRIDLQSTPAPATKPVAVASAADASAHSAVAGNGARHQKTPSTQPAPLQMDLFKNKQPSGITLDDHALVRSSLTATNGDILREFEMKAPLIYYAIAATRDLPAHSLLVPSAGQMLTRDNQDPAVKPAAGENAEMSSSRGTTAFQWNKMLLYTEDTHEAVMTGDVVVVHQDADDKQFPVRLTSDKVFAYFQPVKEKAPAAKGGGPAAPPAGDSQQSLQLKSVRAAGHLMVTRGTGELSGERLDYDPATHWLKVYGTDTTPATFNDTATGRSPTYADEIWWNTVTWHIKTTDIKTRSVR